VNIWGGRMENKINLKFAVIFFIILVIMVGNVLALGITPGRTTINIDKGGSHIQNHSFSVLNNEHKNLKILLNVQGELNQSITLYDVLVDYLPSEESKQFDFQIKIDNKLEPGLHTAEIVAMEIPSAGVSGTYVGATVAVVSQVYVYVPYPGKYLDSDLNVLDGEQDTTATFIVPIINRGSVGIGEARAIIDIYTSLNEKISSVETDYRPVSPGERTELSGKWNVSVTSGNYLAKVTLLYDGETRIFEKQFGIGSQMLSIESILVNNFHLGEIAKLNILVENKWNEELKDVFANLIVYNDDNQPMADIKSATENIASLSKKELVAYWDTVGVNVGEYNGKLIVKYGAKSADKNLLLKVGEDNLDVIGVGYAIRSESSRKGMDMTFILIVVVVILVIVNLSWLIFFKRMSAKKK
jgi:hypothetical protein